MADAIEVVNANLKTISGTLRASGWVDGAFVDDDGRLRSYNVDATFLYLAPGYVRFDLKSFGQRRFLFGSNADNYWFYNRQDKAFHCGLHGDEEPEARMPVQPRQLIAALGLSPIAESNEIGASPSGAAFLVQRVLSDYQQILYLVYTDGGELSLQREYWLDRHAPRLIRKVVFRDPDGVTELESRLDDYQPLGPDGPWLPQVMIAEWPKSQARMRFRIGRWSVVEQVTPQGPQFATPAECNR